MQYLRAESVGGGLYEVYEDGKKLPGTYTLAQIGELCDSKSLQEDENVH